MEYHMTIEAYIFVALVWGSITSLMAYCLWKVLKTENKQ